MQDEKDTPTENNEDQKSFRVVSQAIEDFSFENPGFGKTIQNNGNGPEISVNVHLKTKDFSPEQNLYHVSVNIKADSKIIDENLFIIDLTYSGIFETKGFDQAITEQLLNIQAPNLLFPFIRHMIVDATAQGGYPPLYLDPIDFAGLYFRKQSEQNNGNDQESSDQKAVN